jgi:hypothetical protein
MERKIISRIAAAALALGAVLAGSAANAGTYVQAQVQVAPPVYVQPAPARAYGWGEVAPRGPVYVQHDDRRDERRWRGDRERHHEACSAPRWDPNTRYLPGDAVRRHGQLYVATRLSARVYNVNSAPEWTPNSWARAACCGVRVSWRGRGRTRPCGAAPRGSPVRPA